jgi:hypothetical protein
MLTHEAPLNGTDAVRAIRVPSADPRYRFSDDTQAYVNRGGELMERAYQAVQPLLLAHGHYHVKARTLPLDGRRVISLDCERHAGNLASLNLDTLETEWLRPHHG